MRRNGKGWNNVKQNWSSLNWYSIKLHNRISQWKVITSCMCIRSQKYLYVVMEYYIFWTWMTHLTLLRIQIIAHFRVWIHTILQVQLDTLQFRIVGKRMGKKYVIALLFPQCAKSTWYIFYIFSSFLSGYFIVRFFFCRLT